MIGGQSKLTGKQKSAILLVSLGMDTSAAVMSKLSEEDIEVISLEIADMDVISQEIRLEIMEILCIISVWPHLPESRSM